MSSKEWREVRLPIKALRLVSAVATENYSDWENRSRKLRLFACACCRRTHDSGTAAKRTALADAVEKYADHGSSLYEMLLNWSPDVINAPEQYVASERAWEAACRTAGAARSSFRNVSPMYSVNRALLLMHEQCDLLHDVFGDPFSPDPFDPRWRTADSVRLAEAAYDERIMPYGHLDRDRLAVLSDAVEEAGCDNVEVLNHLRSPGPHVRGCWVVDAVLGHERF